MSKKKLICEQCGNEFRWYRFRRLCNDCRVENNMLSNIKYNKKRIYKVQKYVGTNQFTSMGTTRGKDGLMHIRGWQELERAKKYA